VRLRPLTSLRRLARELAARNEERDVAAALDALVLRDEEVALGVDGVRLLGGVHAPHARRAVVRLMPGVYGAIPTAEARALVLRAARAVSDQVEVHAPLAPPEARAGRLVFDVPRRAARALGVRAAEPGDRWDGPFVHAFFDDEPLVNEAARAGLSFVGRRGAWVRLAIGDAPPEDAATFGVELGRALRALPWAERALRAPPARAVARAREEGAAHPARGTVGRARLRRAIGWVDAVHPRGPSCLRRTLIELALDGGAASETLVFGLDVGRTGHVAFKDTEERTFDVAFEIPP
jgi:hypothetical protein